MTSFTSKSLSVRQLFDWFDDCRFAVPEIQREFVWNTRQVCSLLDSIYKGYPVGSAMVWKTGHKNNNLLRHSLHVLPPFDATRHKLVHFLIDGQQRLSVLHRIRLGQTASKRNAKELHHIWPRALLTRHGIPTKRFNTLCNICFLAAQDNRSFDSKHPVSYLEPFWSRRDFHRVMKSHFIPYKSDSPLWDENVPRGFKAFIDARRKLIEHALNTAAGAKLFES